MASLRATANRKIGGVKTWQWAVILGVAILAGLWLRRRRAATFDTSSAIEESVVFSTQEDQPIGGTVGGGVGGGGVGFTAPEAPPPPFFPQFDNDPFSIFTGGGLPIFDPSLGLAPDLILSPVTTQSASSAPSVAITAPTSTKQTSFVWAGITYRSGDKEKFQRWLKAHGASYTIWKAAHRKAACDVFNDCR